MKIAIVDPDVVDANVTARALAAAGHVVSTYQGIEQLLRAAHQVVPDAVVVELMSDDAQPVSLLRSKAGPNLYILVLTKRSAAASAGASFAAGADDYMRKPLVRDELLARVAKAGRFLSLMAAAHEQEVAGGALARLKAWTCAEPLVCADLSAMTHRPLIVRSGNVTSWQPEYYAQSTLTLSDQQLEVGLVLAANRASLDATARQLMGAPADDPELRQELLLEMANVAAGTLKRGALSEDVVFTLGLPTSVQPTAATAFMEGAEATKHWFVGDDDGFMELTAVIRRRANRVVSISDLREGMVLVGGVRNVSGVLLASAGTRLTMSMIERLRALVPRDFSLEVAHAA